jgi:CheY-like chemotaxis protein
MDVVGVAANGIEIVHLAKTVVADIVLTDLRMPVMDGIEAARRITAAGPPPLVIILSAYGDASLQEEAKLAGVTRWLNKGLKPRDLCASVYEVAGRLAPA